MELSIDGVTGSMKSIGFSHLRLNKKGKLLKSNFTINRAQTLFGPDWTMLKEGRCPHCCNRLVSMPSKKGYVRCLSKKHKKAFVIHRSKIDSIVAKV